MKPRLYFIATLVSAAFLLSPIQASDWNALISGGEVSGFSVEGTTKIDVQEARILHDQGVAFVDFRDQSKWAEGHVAGAIHCGNVTESNIASIVSKDTPVVFYCEGAECRSAAEAAAMAVEWGFQSVHYFAAGYAAWEAAGHPVE